ncbi:MAG: DUF2922 domain-containing protein [Firmicutes bacterium]|jgi:hypothetical protein|nr:DUF2922 domain-containing protein [Bacillota bacterium]
MALTLQMVFRNEENRNVSISVPDALDTVDGEAVGSVMAEIISRNVFSTSGGDLVERVRAQLVSRTVDTLVEF